MDLTRDIIYRNFKLNDSTVAAQVVGDGLGQGMSGCVLDTFDPDDTDVVQFSEKRAEADGMDVGSPFFGARRIRLSGTVYGQTRALCYDTMRQLRAVLDPVLASRESPADKGYLPLYFTEPTNDIADFATGTIDQRALVMPKVFRAPSDRDMVGGVDGDALAWPWSAVLVMKDPKFEGIVPQDVAFSQTTLVTGATATASTDLINKASHGLSAGARIYITALTGGAGLALNTSYYVLASGLTSSAFKVSLTPGGSAIDITSDATVLTYVVYGSVAGNFLNRGTYNSPLNMLFSVGPLAGTITVVAGQSNFTITVPASSNNRIIRVKREKLITAEELGVETLRRSWLTFTGSNTWPLVSAGVSAYTVTINGLTLIDAASHMWFWEQYA